MRVLCKSPSCLETVDTLLDVESVEIATNLGRSLGLDLGVAYGLSSYIEDLKSITIESVEYSPEISNSNDEIFNILKGKIDESVRDRTYDKVCILSEVILSNNEVLDSIIKEIPSNSILMRLIDMYYPEYNFNIVTN